MPDLSRADWSTYDGPRCVLCGAARGDDQRHKHEMPDWKPRYNDLEGGLEGYETIYPCAVCGWAGTCEDGCHA